jgi:hypothetical protein
MSVFMCINVLTLDKTKIVFGIFIFIRKSGMEEFTFQYYKNEGYKNYLHMKYMYTI